MTTCQNCQHQTSETEAAFCPKCGDRIQSPGASPQYSVSNSITGDGNTGNNQTVNTGPVTYALPAEGPRALLEATPLWRSPLTQAGLAWIGAVMGVISLAGGLQLFRPLIMLVTTRQLQPPADMLPWLGMFMVGLMGLALALAGHRLAKHGTWAPLAGGWSIAGSDGRLTLFKFSGVCPEKGCGGELKFRREPTKWLDYADGRRKVTASEPVAHCPRSEKHGPYWMDEGERVLAANH